MLSHRISKLSQLNSYRESQEKSEDHDTKERSSKDPNPINEGSIQEAIKIITDENTTLNIGESQTLVNRGDGSLQTTLNKPDAEPFKSMQIEPKPISAYAEEMSNTKKLWMESRRKNGSKNDAGNSV